MNNPTILAGPELYRQSKRLSKAKLYREKLADMREYLETCADQHIVLRVLQGRLHLLANNDMYALRDLSDIHRYAHPPAHSAPLCPSFSSLSL